MAREDNPFLGQRGIRLSFAMPDLFRSQLRAILRAASHGEIKIMFPMITSVHEFRRAADIVEEIRREVDAPEVDVGIMVEVPRPPSWPTCCHAKSISSRSGPMT